MRSRVLKIFSYKSLELISLVLVLSWCFSPLICYYMKASAINYIPYLKKIISISGIYGYLVFIIYKIRNFRQNKCQLKGIIKNNIPIFLIILLLYWAVISTIYAPYKHLAIYGETYRNEGLLMYFCYAGLAFLVSSITNKKYLSYIFKAIILVSVILVTLPILDTNISFKVILSGYANIFCNPNHYGYYLLVVTCLALFNFLHENSKIKQIIFLMVYAYLNYFLIINNTFGCYLAFLIMSVCLLIYAFVSKWNIKKSIIGISVFVVLSLFATDASGSNVARKNMTLFYSDIKTVVNYETKVIKKNNESTIQKSEEEIQKEEMEIKNAEIAMNKTGSSRMILWREAINQIKEHPIVGGGIECLNNYYAAKGISQDRPHNMLLQIASFIGLPGAIIYLVLIIYLAIYNLIIMFKSKNELVITVFFTSMSYFISSMFGNSMYYTSPYFMILLGILIYYARKKQN